MIRKPKTTVTVSAPGKVILSGEHAVVYGYPALLSAINRRIVVKVRLAKSLQVSSNHPSTTHATMAVKRILEILGSRNSKLLVSIDSNIPVGSGLGSSAALAVASSAALTKLKSKFWNLRQINEIAYRIEKLQHGNPSGGDNTISTFGGFMWYRKEVEGFKTFLQVKIKKKLPDLFLLDSGKPKETTAQMVQKVKEYYLDKPIKVRRIFQEIESITRSFLKLLLDEQEISLSELINENQLYLERLGVVSQSTSELVKIIKRNGGAAKITGAGGYKAGSGMLLVYHPEPKKLLVFAQEKKLTISRVRLGEKGVRIEKES